MSSVRITNFRSSETGMVIVTVEGATTKGKLAVEIAIPDQGSRESNELHAMRDALALLEEFTAALRESVA
jgi:hypothetical protein